MKVTDVGAALDPQFERVSDTPRTDHAFNDEYCYSEYVSKEFAQQLERELAEAQKDAERYRWLRDDERGRSLSVSSLEWKNNAELSDAAIDAAMKEGGK